MPRTAYYFYRVREDDSLIREFCVAGHADPNQYVETLAPDGTLQRWQKREEGDLLVFWPPDGYAGMQGVLWCYDRRLQIGEPMPRPQLERELLRNRHTVACR